MHLIQLLCTNENAKHAANLIKEFKMDINDYPELKERMMKSTMRYYLGRFLYKKNDNDDHISLDRIEDLFTGFKPMLSYLVEDLVYKKKLNEAKGVFLRHKLQDFVRAEIKEELEDVVYDPKKEAKFVDEFAPVSQPKSNYISMPSHVQVIMI